MLQAILFDIYGTLLDTATGSVDACAKILHQNGQPPISPAYTVPTLTGLLPIVDALQEGARP